LQTNSRNFSRSPIKNSNNNNSNNQNLKKKEIDNIKKLSNNQIHQSNKKDSNKGFENLNNYINKNKKEINLLESNKTPKQKRQIKESDNSYMGDNSNSKSKFNSKINNTNTDNSFIARIKSSSKSKDRIPFYLNSAKEINLFEEFSDKNTNKQKVINLDNSKLTNKEKDIKKDTAYFLKDKFKATDFIKNVKKKIFY